MIIAAIAVSACGGGGSEISAGSGSSSSSSTVSSSSSSSSSSANVASVIVDSGPDSNCQANNDCETNILYTTVTVCAPGSTTNCQTIDHVQVDTGSYGLRIISSVLNSSLASALQAFPVSGGTLAECTQFADGYSWGPIKTADLQIAGESVSSIEFQVIGDPSYSNVPTDCQTTGGTTLQQEDSVPAFGANGIIGVGPFVQDCGPGCTAGAQQGFYYLCSSPTSCTDATVTLQQQVSNPVALFATDNNGVVISLPALPAAGQATASGSLIFGIGTESNNQLGSATVLQVPGSDSSCTYTCGDITTVYNGQTLPQSYIDSGSNGYFFYDTSIPACSGSADAAEFYCPSSTLSLTATNEGTNGATTDVTFSVANALQLSGSFFAFNDIAGTTASTQGGSSCENGAANCTFDWGLPFFFGRNVFTAIDGMNTPAGLGPFFAY